MTLSFLVLDSERIQGWLELSFPQFIVFLFLGSLLLGQMNPWFSRLQKGIHHRSFSSSSLTPSRILTWFLWFWLVHSGTPDLWLRNALDWGIHWESLNILLLLLCYWIADALASNHISQNGIQGLKEKAKMAFWHSRIQLPILLLGTLQAGWLFLLRHFQNPFQETGVLGFEILSSLVLLFIAAPPILIHSWGVGPPGIV